MRPNTHSEAPAPSSWTKLVFTLGIASLVLWGCGGGESEAESKAADEPTALAQAGSDAFEGGGEGGVEAFSANNADRLQLARGAQLNKETLEAAELKAQQEENASLGAPVNAETLAGATPGAIAFKSAYASGLVAAKAIATRRPAYRFYNNRTRAHFYTTSESERNNVQANLSPPFTFEGSGFSVADSFSPGLSPVYRFYNTTTGVHFYTISETERQNVATNLPQFRYEGVAYHASQVAGQGLIPLYRFYVPSGGFHFYTAGLAERDNVIANLAATYSYEGVGYYVLETNWRAEKLPHTGVTDQQCFEAGGITLIPCSDPFAIALNPQQDGHRAAINPLSYSQIVNPQGGNFPLTSCVQDNVTGLIWEGKTAGGAREGSNGYTNLGNLASGDASAYVNLVNQLTLCGYSDWRIPTRLELLTLVDYGTLVSTGLPRINNTWFPNTAQNLHWTSDLLNNVPAEAWVVSFNGGEGWSGPRSRAASYPLRLVRGWVANSTRFTFSSVPYSGDAANNLVNDALTGLQWRRCEEGRTWNGTACIGMATSFDHEAALSHAADRAGWRLPNLKELSSLVDLTVGNFATAGIDGVAFPGTQAFEQWSTTPYVDSTFNAGYVSFSQGYVDFEGTGNLYHIRLVRNN